MLVITRGEGQRIMIGDGIVIEIARILGDKVRVGIEAPADVTIDREEVYRAKRRHDEKGDK